MWQGDHYLLTFPTHYLFLFLLSHPPFPFMPPPLPTALSHTPPYFLLLPMFLSLLPLLLHPRLHFSHCFFTTFHLSAFHFHHATTPVPHPQSHLFISTIGFFLKPYFFHVSSPPMIHCSDFFATTFPLAPKNLSFPTHSSPPFISPFNFHDLVHPPLHFSFCTADTQKTHKKNSFTLDIFYQYAAKDQGHYINAPKPDIIFLQSKSKSRVNIIVNFWNKDLEKKIKPYILLKAEKKNCDAKKCFDTNIAYGLWISKEHVCNFKFAKHVSFVDYFG